MSETRAGQNWLHHHFELNCQPASVESWCGPISRKTIIDGRKITERYPAVYAPEETVAGHLKFALKNETLDMGVIARTMRAVDPLELENWLRSEPKGAYARRAWFMYEWFTGNVLDLPDAGTAKYVDALTPENNIGSKGVNSARHKVIDNMLGVPGMCLTVKPTNLIRDYKSAALNAKARDIVMAARPELLDRAIQYLFTKETRSSFEIEHEEPSTQKAERFVAALRNAASFDPANPGDLIQLQNAIVDPAYAATKFRDYQNFVGESIGPDYEKVHFVCPRPEDVPGLMKDWAGLAKRLQGLSDPVVAAAAIAFAFVYIHPFDDGNGRIHRFLLHHILSREGFTPPDFLFPVSAAIVRDQRSYDATLESFSRPTLARTDWVWNADQTITVKNETADLFKYFDATDNVEFLYKKIENTVEKDLIEEIEYITRFDSGYKALRDAIDMPDRKAALFVKLIIQNGAISTAKRPKFNELSNERLADLERIVARAVESRDPAHTNDAEPEG